MCLCAGDVAFRDSRGGGDADERFVRLLAMQTASDQPPAKRASASSMSCAEIAKLSLEESDVAKVQAWRHRSVHASPEITFDCTVQSVELRRTIRHFRKHYRWRNLLQ